MKKSQVSQFIIVGILIFVLLLIGLNSKDLIADVYQESFSFGFGYDGYKNYLISCIDQKNKDDIRDIGLTAGWMKVRDDSVSIMDKDVNLLYYPLNPIDEIKTTLEKRVNFNIHECAYDLENQSRSLISIDSISPESFVIFNNQGITINVEPDIDLTYKDSVKKIESLRYSYDVKFSALYDIISNLVLSLSSYDGMIDMDILHQPDFNSTVVDINESIMLFAIEDHDSKIDNKPFVFIFGRSSE